MPEKRGASSPAPRAGRKGSASARRSAPGRESPETRSPETGSPEPGSPLREPGPGAPDRDATALRRDVTIVNRRGLHARAAAKFAKVAGGFDAVVEVSRNDMAVTADSIMGLMMLAAAPGCSIGLTARGREAEAAMAALIALVSDGFEEDD